MTPTEKLAVAVKALRWYADKGNYHLDDWGILSVVDPPDYGKPGDKARRALRKIGERP